MFDLFFMSLIIIIIIYSNALLVQLDVIYLECIQ